MTGGAILLSSVRKRDEGAITVEAGTVVALIAAAQRGDLRAFERLYRLHVSRVMGLCLRMTRERDVAEDCVQMAFIKAWKNIGRFENRSSFATWLHGIAVREVLSHRRSSKSWLEFSDESAERFDTLDGSLRHDDGFLLDVERAVAALPDGARYVLVLQAIYGYSHDEVAAMLGLAVGTCKAQLHRARVLLKTNLNSEDARD